MMMGVYLMGTSEETFNDLPKSTFKINNMLQAEDFAKQVLKEWAFSFTTGIDPFNPEIVSYKSLGWLDQGSDWEFCRNMTSLFAKLISKEQFTYMDFDIPTEETCQSGTNPDIFSNGEGIFKDFFYTYSWVLSKVRGVSKGACTLTLQPHVEILLENESSKEITYLISVFGSIKCGKFIKKHKCTVKKTIKLGQNLSVNDFWLHIRSNCFYVYELLLNETYMFSLSKKEN